MDKALFDTLYYFEHRLLPDLVYHADQDYKPAVIEHPEVLYDMFDRMCKDHNLENPYEKSDFSSQAFRFDDEWLGVVIDFPMPQKSPLCVQAYMIFDHKGGRCGYYTLEIGLNQENEICGYLCAWDENGNHGNYGERKLENVQKIFEEAYELHIKSANPMVVTTQQGSGGEDDE